jgi:hypothetical protein
VWMGFDGIEKLGELGCKLFKVELTLYFLCFVLICQCNSCDVLMLGF